MTKGVIAVIVGRNLWGHTLESYGIWAKYNKWNRYLQ